MSISIANIQVNGHDVKVTVDGEITEQRLRDIADHVRRVEGVQPVRQATVAQQQQSQHNAPAAERYQGHNVVGGLQAHSTGDIYPWDVRAVGPIDDIRWQAVNHVTGERCSQRTLIATAYVDVRIRRDQEETERQRVRFIAAVQAGPIHTFDELTRRVAAQADSANAR